MSVYFLRGILEQQNALVPRPVNTQNESEYTSPVSRCGLFESPLVPKQSIRAQLPGHNSCLFLCEMYVL